MKLTKNKKAYIAFMWMVLIITFGGLVSFYQSWSAKHLADRTIGDKQFALFETYQDGEELKFYLDLAAKYSAQQALHDLAANAGLDENACGEFNGYPLLYTPTQECFPTDEELAQSFQELFNQNMQEYYQAYSEQAKLDTPLTNVYSVELIQGDQLVIVANPVNALSFSMTGKDDKIRVVLGGEIDYPNVQSPTRTGRGVSARYSEAPQSYEKCAYVLEYGEDYIGTSYSQASTEPCRAENAKKAPYDPDYCTTQCGNFVSSIFMYSMTEADKPSGDGDEKCTANPHTENNIFKDKSKLIKGDIFSVRLTQGSTSIGHTGVFAGIGKVSNKIGESGIMYADFEENPDGEIVFLHSFPNYVGYTTYSEFFAESGFSEDSLVFCRHNKCCIEDDCGELK